MDTGGSLAGGLPEGQPVRLNEWMEPAMWVLAVLLVLAGAFLFSLSSPQSARYGGLFNTY